MITHVNLTNSGKADEMKHDIESDCPYETTLHAGQSPSTAG